jgi:hypothetical protein
MQKKRLGTANGKRKCRKRTVVFAMLKCASAVAFVFSDSPALGTDRR